jgi:uncharacterized membrane protein YfcA
MEITVTTYLIVLPLIFFAGLVDSIAGGGGLISVPAYMVAGLPPHFVLGNNKFSSCIGTTFTTARYFKHGLIDIKFAIWSAIFALIGSSIGTNIVLMLDPHFLNYVLLFLLPIILIFSLIKKDLGKVNNSHLISNKKKYFLIILASLVIGFYDGFFGPGTGAFLILFFTGLLHYDFVKANGNTKVINLSSNIAALTTFLIHGKVLFALAIPAAVFGILGNLVGSKIVLTKGSKIIKPFFLIVVGLLFIKILWTTFFSK